LYAVGSKHGNEAPRIHTDVHGLVLFLEKNILREEHSKRHTSAKTNLVQIRSVDIRMTCKIQWELTRPRIHLW